MPWALTLTPPAPGQNPDLANLYDFVSWAAGKNRLALSFLDPRWKDLSAWKEIARPLFLRQLSFDPPALPLGADTLDRELRDGLEVETLSIHATEAHRIPAWLVMPSRRRGRLPGVLAMHCHGGCYVWGHGKILSHPDDPEHLVRYRQNAYGRPYAEHLARRGFAVLVIDAFYFGLRRLAVESLQPAGAPPAAAKALVSLAALKPKSSEWYAMADRICQEYEHLTAKTLFSAGITWPGLLVWDDRRSLDYLASRPEVDPDRLGCLGLSIGGLRTAHLIAADPRIKAACITGWMTEFRTQLRNHLRHHTWMIYIPGLYAAMDLPDAAGLMAPNALLVQQCSRDILYPEEGMQSSVKKLLGIWTKAGASERFRGVFHDVPHSFSPAMQEEAFQWLEKWLRS
ncbi:MAG: dienelactone hydrolase family protein [Acidobacteriota bacterium]